MRRLTWTEAVDEFLGERRRRNASPATLETYRANLLGPRGHAWLVEHGVRSVAELTAPVLRELELDMSTRLAPATVHQYHRTLHTFLRFCAESGLEVDDRALLLRGPRIPDHAPEPFTADEERRLLTACRTERDRILIETMVRTGLRLSEAVSLTLDDIVQAPEGSYLRVRQGKGRKDRVVPLDTRAVAWSRKLASYVRRVRPAAADPHLFLADRRRGGDWTPITPHGVKQMFRRLSLETGIHAHAHRCRHTFATRALAAGVDPLTLQRALGHTTLEMVNRYIHSAPSDLLRAWSRRDD